MQLERCKTKIQTLGQTCKYCRHRFCLTHALAEVHGCGDLAKQEARTHIRQTGNLNVNSQYSHSNKAQMTHNVAAKKLTEKISKMQSGRNKSGAKKDE